MPKEYAMTTPKPEITHGRCQCRKIEYEFEGKPKWVMHCHCESCRRAVSSAVATYVGVNIDQFRYLKGEPAAYASSPGVKRYFCPTCGSPMVRRTARKGKSADHPRLRTRSLRASAGRSNGQ